MISHFYKIAYETWRIAQGLSPYRTGNLRHNAIFLKDFRTTKDGASWRINYSHKNAPYLEPLNRGWRTPNGRYIEGKYFVEGAIREIGKYMTGTMSEKRKVKLMKNAITTTGLFLNDNERFARKLQHQKSVKMSEDGKVSPLTDPKEWRKFYGL